MAETNESLKLSVVRPDRMVWEGMVHHVILVTHTGEVGVWPLHSSLISALGNGVMRVFPTEDSPGVRVIISGGYAEVTPHEVIILADHARRASDVDRKVIEETKAAALAKLDELDEDSHRRAYWNEKVAWCDLLLREGEFKD